MLRAHYKNIALQPFTEQLDVTCYDVVKNLCEMTRKQAEKLNHLESHNQTSQYVLLCSKLTEEVSNFIKYRKEQLIPYIQKLYDKHETGHDCSNCKGGCNLQHSVWLLQIRESHGEIKDTLYRLQMAMLPLYSETIYPDEYRILRNQMALLENNLTELLFLEENYLLPKITEAQKNINARS